MYWLTLLPSSQAATGIMNWNAPNHRPILAACFTPKPGMEMPLDTDTAKASRARLTAMRKISTKENHPFSKKKVRTAEKIIAYRRKICYNK